MILKQVWMTTSKKKTTGRDHIIKSNTHTRFYMEREPESVWRISIVKSSVGTNGWCTQGYERRKEA